MAKTNDISNLIKIHNFDILIEMVIGKEFGEDAVAVIKINGKDKYGETVNFMRVLTKSGINESDDMAEAAFLAVALQTTGAFIEDVIRKLEIRNKAIDKGG